LLKPFGQNIWYCDGGHLDIAGFHYPIRMAVMRLAGGKLFIWSPTPLSDALRREVDALGTVSFIVAPNSLHHLSIPAWQAAYPAARTFGAPGLAARVKDLRIDQTLGETPPPEWSAEIDQTPVPGNAITTEVVFFHRESATVLFTDLIQNFPPGWFKGWRGVVAKVDRLTAPHPEVPQKFRVAFTGRTQARLALTRIRAWPAEKVLMAHGPAIATDGGAAIARAFRWL